MTETDVDANVSPTLPAAESGPANTVEEQPSPARAAAGEERPVGEVEGESLIVVSAEDDSEAETDVLAPDTIDPSESIPAVAERLDLGDPVALVRTVEAILFVVEAPVTSEQLAIALERPIPEIETAVASLRAELDNRGSGIEVRSVAGGFRLYSRADVSGWIETFLLEGQRSKLSQAALETLAVVAYRQPVTRARISAIRGVNVDGVVRTLVTRGLIVEAGVDADTGGGVYRTTELFLERMGLNDVSELPSLAPLLPELDSLENDEL